MFVSDTLLSTFMVFPLSHKTSRSWVVGCCMEQHNSPVLHTATAPDAGQLNPTYLAFDMTKERIRKMFNNIELSVSSYDTAWVAMVPSPNSPKTPCFPQCLNWLMDNQLNDGSWGLVHRNPSSPKDALSSTLASIVALKRWNVGVGQINKGLRFIESNFATATEKNQPSPCGFDIIFPSMLEYARGLDIKLPLKQTNLRSMLHERELQLKGFDSIEREAYLAYISEGLGNFYDLNMVMKYQMKNGSVLNSPSATAAALIHHQNAGCLDYLMSLLEKFGDAVPTVYPRDLYVHLSMVETLERLGIARHFRKEIQNVLDDTYKCWVLRDEQIFMDVATCALAFRALRTNQYDISSDPPAEITKDGPHINSFEEPLKDVIVALEVCKLAPRNIYKEEIAFGEENLRSADILKRKTSTASNGLSNFFRKEVGEALEFPIYDHFDVLSTRRNIEHYNLDDTRILKTAYCSSLISNMDYLSLAVEDYNACQSIYLEELKVLERWVVDSRLDELKFARQKTAYCYFGGVLTVSSPQLSDARISMAKSSILATVIDDFFDVGGSMDEVVNLILCVEKWNINVDTDCCSEEVAIIFLALKDTVCWIRDKAFNLQSRDVTTHVIQTWVDMMKTMLREAIWARDGRKPTISEYVENGYVSLALGPIVLPALYLMGPKLSEEIIQSYEYHKLFELMGTHGRLLNDIRSFKRELKAGQLNAVTLHENYGKIGIEEEEIIEEIKMLIKNHERELMKLVMETKGSIVPNACKDAFWKMCGSINLFYATDDGYSGNNIIDIVKEVIYKPVSHLLIKNGTL